MDYVTLRKEVIDAGLLERQYGYYFFKFISTAALLAASIAILVLVDNFAIQLLNAAFLAFVFVQFTGLMHDSQHQQIFKSASKNDFAGMITGNLVLAASSGAWKLKHNEHHNSPNDVDEDPDINISVLAYSEEQALKKKGVNRLITKYQAFLWFPILTFTAVSKRTSLLATLLQNLNTKKIRHVYAELFLIIMSLGLLYMWAPLHFLGLWKGLAFMAVNQAFTGLYMGSIFATNHKAMPLTKKEQMIDFATRQIITTRNVKGSPLIDFWTGGLNYQIEHHLFPTMPRNNLSKAKRFVEPFCRQMGIEYYETGFFHSYKEILQHFHKVSAVLRKPKHAAAAPMLLKSAN